MVILDTNILIKHLRLQEASEFEEAVLRFGEDDLSISVLTVQELFVGKSSVLQEKKILKIISRMKIWSYDIEIAKKAGEIVRDLKTSKFMFVDAAIAATSLINKCQLFTLNKKDFLRIKGLELVEI